MADVVSNALLTVGLSLAFLAANVLILRLILALNRRAGPSSASRAEPPSPKEDLIETASPWDVLGWEFEYARVTASEAMNERHTMVNFYLLIAGVVLTGVTTILVQDAPVPTTVGTVLLWLLCGIGWLYFLGIIRLRQAWHDSAQAMNQIKAFAIRHAGAGVGRRLREAFRWQAHTLPPADKPWTVYFYSAMLIALLNSAAYVGGGALLQIEATRASPALVLGPLAVLGLAFFAFHGWLYFAFLKVDHPGRRGSHGDGSRSASAVRGGD